MTERNTDEELVLTKNIFEKKMRNLFSGKLILSQMNPNTYSAFPFPIFFAWVSLSYTHIKKNGP